MHQRVTGAHAFLQLLCCSRPKPAAIPRSGTGFLSYLGLPYPYWNRPKGKKRKKAEN